MRTMFLAALVALTLAGCRAQDQPQEVAVVPSATSQEASTTSPETFLDFLEESEWVCKNQFHNDPEARACQVLKEHPEYEPRIP